MRLFISLKSTTVKRSYGILTLVTPLDVGGALKGKIVSMVYLVVNIIKLSHETLYITANDHFGDRGMLYRSKIGDDVEEISHICYLGLGNATVGHSHESGGLGAVERDQGRFQ